MRRRQAETHEQNRKNETSPARFLGALAGTAGLLAGLCALTVFMMDPFYHYHKPWFGLKAVLSEKEYQVVGSLRHFEYDSVLVGSSVVENNDNRWYDEAFGGTTIKAVRSYGGVADLVWYLQEAFAAQEVKRVYFNLDPSSLIQEAETTFEASGCPMYLYDRNPFNDVKYLLNATVLFQKIPYELVQSFSADYEEGLSYNWADGKDFSENGVLTHYARRSEVAKMLPETEKEQELQDNLALLEQVVRDHPETEFYFFYPPYSMIWWDDAVRSGLRDVYLYDEAQIARTLLAYGNVHFYDFQNDTETVTDLNRYMDTVHFDPQVNYDICIKMAAGQNELTMENLEETFQRTRELVDDYEAEEISQYEADGKFIYE